ncbi:hypothetical protein K435DRAFT_899453 [Dendrothele bispora CBS 962.96]|uniref:Uncharacterized protein n=1 Tax=Dendrothele bispora (strain CBS 962.96) TaxID=1314807 RepID=A0A4S8LYA8_DENBC|nr:hypothetical protein K435DRAFT_899453 [Dendrothele bispora CBS 962.96]
MDFRWTSNVSGRWETGTKLNLEGCEPDGILICPIHFEVNITPRFPEVNLAIVEYTTFSGYICSLQSSSSTRRVAYSSWALDSDSGGYFGKAIPFLQAA